MLLCRAHDELTSHYEGLLIGQSDLMPALDSEECGAQARKADEGGEHDVVVAMLRQFAEPLGANEYGAG